MIGTIFVERRVVGALQTAAPPRDRHGRDRRRPPSTFGPRDQAALRPRVPRAGGDVIGVEQKAEALVELAIAGGVRLEQELSRRTRWCARDAIWSGSRPPSTARSDLRPTAARRGARSPRARCGRPRTRCAGHWRPAPRKSARARRRQRAASLNLRGGGNSFEIRQLINRNRAGLFPWAGAGRNRAAPQMAMNLTAPGLFIAQRHRPIDRQQRSSRGKTVR